MSVIQSVLGSGSCGNSYVFYDGSDAILIDDGFSLAELKRRLERVCVPIESVRCMFLTHLHPDHHLGFGVVGRKLGLPLYLNKEAIEGEDVKFKKLCLPPETVRPTEPGEIIEIGHFTITSFKTSHDSKGSVGYFITNGDEKFTLITDTGIVNDEMAYYAKQSNVLYLEANYDENLLNNGPYPAFLKKRISGNWGHLSNKQAFTFLKDSGFKGKGVFFIHLSRNNNTVALVNEEAAKFQFPFITYACPRGELVNSMEVLHG